MRQWYYVIAHLAFGFPQAFDGVPVLRFNADR